MRINTNMAALNAWRALTVNNNGMTKSLEKLSSGYRVNRAADDAAGLAVSEKMRAQIRGLNMAVRNAQDGVSMLQTAEGGASQIQTIVQRMRELAIQASNGALTDDDRALIDKEFQQLLFEVDRTAKTTKFNGLNLLTGAPGDAATVDAGALATYISMPASDLQLRDATLTVTFSQGNASSDGSITIGGITVTESDENKVITVAGLTIDLSTFSFDAAGTYDMITITGPTTNAPDAVNLQVGANDTDQLSVNLTDLSAVSLQLNGLSIGEAESATEAVRALDAALKTINESRAELGSYQNRLENAIGTLQIQSENLSAAESRIRDVDMAQEMANFTKYQILQQASTAMLAQANMSTQSILSLLR